MKNIGILHVITDITIQSRFTHDQLARMAIAGGADTIQFRQKHGSTRQHIERLELVKSVCTSPFLSSPQLLPLRFSIIGYDFFPNFLKKL